MFISIFLVYLEPPSERPLFTKFHIVKSYSNEEFSIHIIMIFDVDSNYVHPRFWIRPLICNIRNDFVEILRFLRKSTSWNQVLWNLVVSNLIPGDFRHPRKSPYVSWFIFKIIDFWWFLVDFLVFSCEESASHPLSSTGWVPQVIVDGVWIR